MSEKAKNRAPGYEACPGCVEVDVNDGICAPGNLRYCTASQTNTANWTPGACVGCHVIANGGECRSGHAGFCAVAWLRQQV